VVCVAQATVVFLDEKFKPVRMPKHVRELLAGKHAEYVAHSHL
jgi:acyl-CoA thioesterase FadM